MKKIVLVLVSGYIKKKQKLYEILLFYSKTSLIETKYAFITKYYLAILLLIKISLSLVYITECGNYETVNMNITVIDLFVSFNEP